MIVDILKRLQENAPSIDAGHLYSVLIKYPQNRLIRPEKDDFAVFDELAEYNLVVKFRSPIWQDGRFAGAITLFGYNTAVDYSNVALFV